MSTIAFSGLFAATRCVASVCRSTCEPLDGCSIPARLNALATTAVTAPAAIRWPYGKPSERNRAGLLLEGRQCRTYSRTASLASSGSGIAVPRRDFVFPIRRVPDRA
jgi:hypothetical protein